MNKLAPLYNWTCVAIFGVQRVKRWTSRARLLNAPLPCAFEWIVYTGGIQYTSHQTSFIIYLGTNFDFTSIIVASIWKHNANGINEVQTNSTRRVICSNNLISTHTHRARDNLALSCFLSAENLVITPCNSFAFQMFPVLYNVIVWSRIYRHTHNHSDQESHIILYYKKKLHIENMNEARASEKRGNKHFGHWLTLIYAFPMIPITMPIIIIIRLWTSWCAPYLHTISWQLWRQIMTTTTA